MKIIVDAYGGDNCPDEIIKGAIAALDEAKDLSVILTGDKGGIEKVLKDLNFDGNRLEIIHAPEVITNCQVPTEAIRKNKQSSIVMAYKALNQDEQAKAFVSAGSTGAVLSGGFLLLDRIKGITRPALAPILPTVKGGNVILIDCGANVACKPDNLVNFAYMGKAYAKAMLNVDNARVALLSNGTEEGKGNDLNKEVFGLLKSDNNINFVGNIEAREILSGDIDVVVTDGFSGNIALKSLEGTALSMMQIIKNNILAGGIRAKLGYLLLKPAFKGVKKAMDYNDKGGAILLGLEKIVVKCHGSSTAKSIKAGILQAKSLIDGNIIEQIKIFLAQQVQ